MKLWVVGVLGLGLAGACTKANPAAKCTNNGTCTDPNFPFCDVDGSVGGQPGTCIAVTCTAGQFKSCSGSDTALVCDANVMTFDPTSCVNGCADGSGCVTCTPNTQACANNVTTSCDGSGRLSTTTCSLGCSADATRCLKIVPSNSLGMYYDATTSPQDLDLENGTLELDAGTFDDGTTMTTLPSYDVAAPAGGAPIRVFVVKHLTLGNITITSTTAQGGTGGVGRAVAFLATGDIDVTGRVAVRSGAVSITGCNGGLGMHTDNGMALNTVRYFGGDGGGGHATAGAAGGAAPNGASGGPAGTSAAGEPTLVPLRGGCPGGEFAGTFGEGGGAIQLTSETSIQVMGAIVADGGSGNTGGRGGGAGGGILLEAPSVTINAAAMLLARGGGGGAGNTAAPMPPDDANGPKGGTCSPASKYCGNGGNGAGQTTPATAGSNTGNPSSTTDGPAWVAGGGGGGRGYIRINTVDGTFTPPPGSVTAGSLSVGMVGTL